MINLVQLLYHRIRRTFASRVFPLSVEKVCPFFIVGSGRCGSTLLRRILTAHSRVCIPPEMGYLAQVIEGFRQRAWRKWPQLCANVLDWYRFTDNWKPLIEPIVPSVLVRLQDLPPDLRSLGRIIDLIYRVVAPAQGKDEGCLWGDKTPANTDIMPKIHEVFPGARFIHLLRDGCDVVASFLEKDNLYTFESAAERWRDSVVRARQFAGKLPKQVLEIRYEELVRDPEASVRRCCALLEIDFKPEMLAEKSHAANLGDVAAFDHHRKVLDDISTDSIGKGRRTLSTEQLARLQVIIGPMLAQCEYERAA